MFETLKIIHMFGILGGGASGIGNGILMARAMRAGGPPPDYVRATMKTLGMIGLGSILLLWITGIAMVESGNVPMSMVFGIKLVSAAAVLLASSTLTVHTTRAAAAGRPPNPAVMRTFARVGQVGVVVAVIFAVLAFH